MGSFGFPFPSSNDSMIMDRNGITGQGPLYLPKRRRPEDDYGQDQTDPEFGGGGPSPSPTSTASAAAPSIAPPISSTSSLPPRQSTPPMPDSGYGELADLTHDPRRQPKDRNLGYRILGALAQINPISAQFSDDITYGTKAASAKHDWQQDVALQQMRNKAGQAEAANQNAHDYHNVLGQYHQDTLEERARKDRETAANNIQKTFDTQSGRAAQRHARPIPQDVPTDIGTIPGRRMVPNTASWITIPPNPDAQPGDTDYKSQQMWIPSEAQTAAEKATSKADALSSDDITNSQIDVLNKKGYKLPKRAYNPDEQKRIADLHKTVLEAEEKQAALTAKKDHDPFAVIDYRDQKKQEAENRTGKRKATDQYQSELRKSDDDLRSSINSLQNETEFKNFWLNGALSEKAPVELHQKLNQEKARRMGVANQAKRAAYDAYRQRMLDAGQDPGPNNPPTPYDTAWADSKPPATGAPTASAAAPATQSALPPRQGPATPGKLTEADIRTQARAKGKDENVAVDLARKHGII